MNDAPRSYLTPADRDAAMIEASRLRAMSLRREAVEVLWNSVGHALRRLGRALSRQAFHSQQHKEV